MENGLLKRKLSNNIEFRRVFSNGIKRDSKNLRMFILKNQHKFNRLGIVIKKEVGKAVVRNKIKRRLKEAFRYLDKKLFQEYDIIIFVKKSAVNLSYLQLYEELKSILNSYKKAINKNTKDNI